MRAIEDDTPRARREAAALAGTGAALGVLISTAFAVARGLADEPSLRAAVRELSSHAAIYGLFATFAAAMLGVLGWLAGKRLDRITVLATTDPLTVVANRHT